MATAAEQLLIRIDATTEQLRREIRNAENSTQTFQRRTDVSLRQVERSFRRVNSVVRQALGVFGGLTAALSVRGLVNFAQSAITTADEIGKMADQVGITTTELQRLRFAAEQSGTSTNTLSSAMERFTRRLGRARADVGPLVGVMEELGLNADDNVEAFRQVADAIAGAGDAMEQARIADAAFGTAGGEMIRMLRGGREALDEFGDAAEQFGLVLSEENIRKAERLNDRFSTLRGILRTVAQEAILDAVSDDLDQITIRFGEFLTEMGRQVARLEDHQDALQFGIIGRILFGRRGMLIGAAIGAIARDVSSFLTMMGITGTPAQQTAQELFTIEQQIERHRQNIETLRDAGQDVSDAPFVEELRQQEAALEALERRYVEVRQKVEETSGGLDAFNEVTRQSSDEAGVLSSLLTNVGQGFISFGQAAELPPRQMAAFAESAQAVADTDADQELDSLRDRLEALRDTLDPSREQIRRYVEQLMLLKEAAQAIDADGEALISTEELRQAVEQLSQQFADIDDGASNFSDAWTSAVDQVDSAFQDFLSRGLRDFDSFADSLINIAQRAAAQIVSEFVRAQLQSQGGLSGLFGGADRTIGGFAGAGGASTSGGLFGLSGIATAGIGFGASLLLGAFSRRRERRRQEREERRNLEARERELEAMIQSVGGLEDLTEKRQRELDQVRGNNREIQERIHALEDELRVAEERQSLEQRYLQVVGNTSALREREIAQTEEQNRALLRAIFAAEDQISRINERNQLEVRALNLMGDTNALRQLELRELDSANRAIARRIHQLEDEVRIFNERLALDQRYFRLIGDTNALRQREIESLDEANRAMLQFIFDIEDAAANLSDAESAVRDAMSAVERAIAEETRKLEEAAINAERALDESFAAVERAVEAENRRLRELQSEIAERQREAETELLDRIRILDTALSGMRARRRTVDPMREFAAAQATLAIAQAGGPLAVDADELERALQIVADPSESLFVSFEDYQREFLRTKRVVEDIEKQAQQQHNEQMSEFEQQMTALEKQIQQNEDLLDEQQRAVEELLGIDNSIMEVDAAVARLQKSSEEFTKAQTELNSSENTAILEEQQAAVNALLGIDDSVLSVEEAVANLAEAMDAFATAQREHNRLVERTPPAAPPQPTMPSIPGLPSPSPTPPGVPSVPDAGGVAPSVDVNALNRRGQVARQLFIADGNLEFSGLNASDLRRAGVQPGDATRQGLERLRQMIRDAGGLPEFADGGIHAGGLRIVGERGPELEATGPSRIMSNEDLMSSLRGDRLVREVVELRKEVAGMRTEMRQTQGRLVKDTRRQRDVLEGWNVEGIPPERDTA